MHFREATSADRDSILALRALCFGDVDREKRDPRFWSWEFRRARIFVGESEDSVVTHLALLDLPHCIDGERVPGALAVDAMTAPAARGKGAFRGLVRFTMEHLDPSIATAYQIRSNVLGAMQYGGWSVAERVPVLVRPAIGFGRPRELPTLDSNDLRWMAELPGHDGSIARTVEFLSWRYFENPLWRYHVAGVREEGYVVTRRTTLKGFDTMAIVDVAARDPALARELIRHTVTEGRTSGCTLVAALAARRHPLFGAFLRGGFLPGPHWFRLLAYPAGQASRAWRVLWGDTDHL